MSAPFFPLQTPTTLPEGVAFAYENNEHFFRMIGRGGATVPEFGLTMQQALPMGRTHAVLVRFRCRNSLGTGGAINQGICIRVWVVTRAGSGTSETPQALWDSAPANDLTGEVWYRETHGDIREVTRVVQYPEEVIGGTHIVVWISSRGTGGYCDIFPGVEVRNHYSRTFDYALGKSVETNFPWTQTDGFLFNLSPYTRARAWDPRLASIASGQKVRFAAEMYINIATSGVGGGALEDFRVGFTLRCKRRSDFGYDWLFGKAIKPPDGSRRIIHELLSYDVSLVTKKAYTEITPYLFFYLTDESSEITLDQEGIDIKVTIDDSVKSGAT